MSRYNEPDILDDLLDDFRCKMEILDNPKKREVEIIFESDDEEKEYQEEEYNNCTWTITFSEQVENHVGMQTIGEMSDEGFSIEELEDFQSRCGEYKTELVDLELSLDEDLRDSGTKAKILIIRNGVEMFMKDKYEDFIKEVKSSSKIVDTKAWMRGRVVNKHARYNLCYGDSSQKPDYERKKGTIVAFKDVPYLSILRDKLGSICDKSKNLLAELNYYYDNKKCGIGFHGDSERRLVIGVRIGSAMNLQYQWFCRGDPTGDRVEIILNEGDFYVMSAKAVGTDWKKRIIPTLRHAAGCSKFTNIKKKEEKE